MPAATFRVELTDSALADLAEMRGYWERRQEGWRGEKYFRDLTMLARTELPDFIRSRRGRLVKIPGHPNAREVLAFGVYRIIYRIDETAGTVNVLRFWHAHRDEPLA